MLECLTKQTTTLADADGFERALACAADSPYGPLGERFSVEQPVIVVRAPARLDCMGGIADYSGSLVCEMTLERAVLLGIQARDDRKVVIYSAGVDRIGLEPDVTLQLDAVAPGAGRADYETLRLAFSREPATAWAAYVAGAFSVLQGEGHVDRFPHGATIVISSNIPLRVGVSSSAALEIAAMCGLNLLYGLNLDGIALAVLSQKVENQVVGAACGIMDQVTSALGSGGRLLSLLCQPHAVQEELPIPAGVHLIGINSGVRREIKGTRYTDARIGAFMGLGIIQDHLRSGNGAFNDPYGGYLCNISCQEYVARYRPVLPARITGRSFVRRYGNTPDPVTVIDPGAAYMVRSRVDHPVYEHSRVSDFTRCIRLAGITGETRHLEEAGKLMYASDWSYTYRCGLGSSETSWIVRETRRLGAAAGFFGARTTGGGSGGTVAVLGSEDMFDHLDRLLARYEESTGHGAELFTGSSPGALEFGHQVYRIT